MKYYKNKTLKKLGKPCSNCDSKETYLILISENIDGVIYPKKYVHCKDCDSLEIFKDQKHKSTTTILKDSGF